MKNRQAALSSALFLHFQDQYNLGSQLIRAESQSKQNTTCTISCILAKSLLEVISLFYSFCVVFHLRTPNSCLQKKLRVPSQECHGPTYVVCVSPILLQTCHKDI